MARTTYVKHARQRYQMKPVLDADGKQMTVPVFKRDGVTPKTTKTGRLIRKRLTVADKSKPLPLLKCEKCGNNIEIGAPYKHVSPKTGAYGGRTRVRCGTCPGWKPSELSSARTAPIMAALEDWDVSGCESKEDYKTALDDLATVIRDVASELSDGATNIEEGFGHETYQSTELKERADNLEGQADDLESALDSVNDEPDPCNEHDENEEDCDDCTELREAWLEELSTACDDAISNIEY